MSKGFYLKAVMREEDRLKKDWPSTQLMVELRGIEP